MEAELAAGSTQRFDLLAVDAFAGDTVPLHLVTREAFEVYRRQLAPNGVLAMHISGVFVDLLPLVYGLAEELGMRVVFVKDRPGETGAISASDWVLVSSNAEFLAHPLIAGAAATLPADMAPLVFTDQYSSLVRLLGARGD
jgi:hypothetical protein